MVKDMVNLRNGSMYEQKMNMDYIKQVAMYFYLLN